MKATKASTLSSAFIALFFIFPYIVFLRFFEFSLNFNWSDFFWALRNTITQSTLAAAMTVVLALTLSRGLLLLSGRMNWIAKALLIVPQVFPAFFSILIALSILNPFPMGSPGMIFIYVMVNLGFATLLLASATEEKLGRLAVVSEIYGFSRANFYFKIYLPLLKSDLINVFFLVFIFCFSSFSVPLIVGGGRGTNIEVLIFEKIFIEQNWSAAFTLSLFQTSFIFALSYFLISNKASGTQKFEGGKLLKSKIGLILLCLYLLFYLGGYAKGLVQSFDYLELFKDWQQDLVESTWASLKILSGYLFLNFVLMYFWLADYINNKKFNWAGHLLSASTVVVGFSFYLLLPSTRSFDFLKIAMAMTCLIFPGLFRLFLQGPVAALQTQLQVAQIYGVPKHRIIFDIIVPQLKNRFLLWLSFLVVWFLSDYAIMKSLGVQTQTLGLMSEGFLSSYRLPLSYLMSFYILVLSSVVIFVLYSFMRVLHVAYKKSAS
jgi:thiamine transport system permease protein